MFADIIPFCFCFFHTFRPSTRRVAATRLHSNSEDAAGGDEDLTKDLPNPPQPLKVEEVHPKTRQPGSDEIPTDGKFIGLALCAYM